MKTNKNLYRALLLGCFLLTNALIIFGIGSAWSYLNSGADKASILHIGENLTKMYQPSVQWNLEGQEGRKMGKQALKDLEKDYINAWYVKNHALFTGNTKGIEDYYTQDARTQLYKIIAHNRKQALQIKGCSLAHHIQLEFYSLDGKMAVLTDHNVEEVEQVQRNGELLYQGKSTATYQVILLLEDGFWRIRQMVKHQETQAETEPGPSPQTDTSVASLKGINYYPQEHPWNMFGPHFNKKILAKDFDLIHTMGLNTIRVFVPYESFGGAVVDPELVKQILSLLDIAQTHDLKVLVTLFDFYGNYDVWDWTLTHRHAETLVNALKDHPALWGWDLKNEPDLDFKSRGRESVLAWLSEMLVQVKKWDPKHPVTIGWSTPEAAHNLQDGLDFISFHYYGKADDFAKRLDQLRATVPDSPLVLEEYGASSYSGVWNLFSNSEKKQAQYLDQMGKLLMEHQLPGMVWTLYDFKEIPKEVVGQKPWARAPQQHFGLIDTQGRKKSAYAHIGTKK